MDSAVRRHCAKLDVRLLTRSRVTNVTPRRIRLQNGTALRSDLTIWTAGASAPPLLRESGLADEPRQWAPVSRSLRSQRFDNVFVVGDASGLPRPLEKQAFYALQMGEFVAENVRRALAGRTLRDFVPSRKPMLVAFGDLDTFLVAGRTVIASPTFAALKEAVFQVTMAQIDPPRDARGLKSMSARLDRAVRHVALPTLVASAARARQHGDAILGFGLPGWGR
jgi:NADH dehydrogenase FAD-containing subunit